MRLSSVLDKGPVASTNARAAPRATETTRGEWGSSPRPGVCTKPMRRAWAVRSSSEQRRWMLAAVSGIGERQRRAVDAAVSDARVCLRQYLASLLLLGGPGGRGQFDGASEGGRGGAGRVPWRRRRRRPCSPWMMPLPRLPASARVSVAERRLGAHVRECECVWGLCALALSRLLILVRPAFLTPYRFSSSRV